MSSSYSGEALWDQSDVMLGGHSFSICFLFLSREAPLSYDLKSQATGTYLVSRVFSADKLQEPLSVVCEY